MRAGRCGRGELPVATESHSLFGLRNYPQIRFWRLPSVWIQFLRFFVRNASTDNHIVARLPVRWGCDFMFRGELNRIDHAEDLVKVAAGGHGITELQLDFLV